MKIQNNNILAISPQGKEYLSTLHWLKTFIPLLLSERTTSEVPIYGKFDGLQKGVAVVSSHPSEKITYDFTKFVEALENNEVINIRGWIFTLTKFIPKQLYKVEISKKEKIDGSSEYTAKW